MFGVSGGELIILLLIGLVVLGPERLPRVANQIGGWLGQARRMTRVMKRQLEEELDLNDSLSIKPPKISRKPSTQPTETKDEPVAEEEDSAELSKPRDDDDYSPAHTADEPGTGVGAEGPAADDGADSAEIDRDIVAESDADGGSKTVDEKVAEKVQS